MQTENIPTLRIHRLTQDQYDTHLSKGNIKENELYLTPYEAPNLSSYVKKDSVFDMVYPIGSIYTSVNSTNPSIFFGGTWEIIDNTYLLISEEELSVYAFKRIS